MDFQQSDSTAKQDKDENKAMNKSDCNIDMATNLANECTSNVTRSQSSASMMMELSALPISDCGAQSEAVNLHNNEKPINQTNDLQNEAKCTSSIPIVSLPHSETNLRNNIIPQMNENQSSLPVEKRSCVQEIEQNALHQINSSSLDSKIDAQKIPQSDMITSANHDTDATISNQSSVASTVATKSIDATTARIRQPNHLIQIENKAPLHHGATNEVSLPSTSESLHNKTASYTVTPNHTQSIKKPPSPCQSPKPLKATKFSHLSAKYKNELQYMLVEFRKLERQLLSGYSGLKNGMENQGARARREKLHSFIIHLEDTAKQIEYGCQRQSVHENKGDDSTKKILDDGSDRNKRRKIEEEENVQRLEEHILANLIPVKARLVKQLAAQGKSQASIGGSTMNKTSGNDISSRSVPIPRGYPQPQNQGPVAFIGKSATSDHRMGSVTMSLNMGCERVTESQYGHPIDNNKGSSLTKKLYGQILGSKGKMEKDSMPLPSTLSDQSTTSDSMTNDESDDFDKSPARKRKILYAGMAPGSDIKAKLASVAAAAGTDQACAEIYENYQTSSCSTSQVPETTKNPLSEIANRQMNESVQASTQSSHAFKTGKVENKIATDAKNKNQPSDNSCRFNASKENTSTQIKHYTNNPMTQQSPPARISPLTSINTASLDIYNKSSLNNSAPNPLNTRRGPATAAVEAAALPKANSSDKYRQPHPEKPMPPPAPLPQKNTPSQILATGSEISQSQIAKIERRKRRLERRRRRRKRRQARLHAITESFKSNGPMVSTHNQHGNSITSTSQYYQSGSGNKSMSHGMKSPGGNNLTGCTYSKIRSVEYICANCNEQYRSTCEFNPWWALIHEECPKCRKTQVPRIDITAPTNTIEYHPALLAHAEEANSNNGSSTNGNAINKNHEYGGKSTALHASGTIGGANGNKIINPDTDFHPDDELNLDDDAESSDASTDEDPLEEDFGKAYKGPKLGDEEAAKILCLIEHASTCPGKHKSTAHSQVCNSVKYMMLHVRDCPGITTCSGEVCPFPWCRKIKHLLYHLVTCVDRETCQICRRSNMSQNISNLVKLNKVRRKKHQAEAKQKITDRLNIPPTATASQNVKANSAQGSKKKVPNPTSNLMTKNPLLNDNDNVRQSMSALSNDITSQTSTLQCLISKTNMDSNGLQTLKNTVMTRPLISKKVVVAQANKPQQQMNPIMPLSKLSTATPPAMNNVTTNKPQKHSMINNPVYSHIKIGTDTAKYTSVRKTVQSSNQAKTIYGNANTMSNANNSLMNNITGNNITADTKLNSSQLKQITQTTIPNGHRTNSNIQQIVEQKLMVLGGNETVSEKTYTNTTMPNDTKTKISEPMLNILISSSNVLQNTDVGDVTNSSSCIVHNPLKAAGVENPTMEFLNPDNPIKSNNQVVTHYVPQQKMLLPINSNQHINDVVADVNVTDTDIPYPNQTISNTDVSPLGDSQPKSPELHQGNELSMFSSEFMRQYPSTNNLNGVTAIGENSSAAQNFENNHMKNNEASNTQQPNQQHQLLQSSSQFMTKTVNEYELIKKDEIQNPPLVCSMNEGIPPNSDIPPILANTNTDTPPSNRVNENTDIPPSNIANANTNIPSSNVPHINMGETQTPSNITLNHNYKPSIVASTCMSSTVQIQSQLPVSTMQNPSSLSVSATATATTSPILSATNTEGDGPPQMAVGCANDGSKENNQLQVSC